MPMMAFLLFLHLLEGQHILSSPYPFLRDVRLYSLAKICVLWRALTTTAYFSYHHLELNAVNAYMYLAWASFQRHWRTGQTWKSQISLVKYKFMFDWPSTSASALLKLPSLTERRSLRSRWFISSRRCCFCNFTNCTQATGKTTLHFNVL